MRRSVAGRSSAVSLETELPFPPTARRRGLAEGMLAEAIARARAMPGLEQLHLWVLNPETSGARLLYLKVGFAAAGPVVRDDLVIDGEYVDAEYMVLRL